MWASGYFTQKPVFQQGGLAKKMESSLASEVRVLLCEVLRYKFALEEKSFQDSPCTTFHLRSNSLSIYHVFNMCLLTFAWLFRGIPQIHFPVHVFSMCQVRFHCGIYVMYDFSIPFLWLVWLLYNFSMAFPCLLCDDNMIFIWRFNGPYPLFMKSHRKAIEIVHFYKQTFIKNPRKVVCFVQIRSKHNKYTKNPLLRASDLKS